MRLDYSLDHTPARIGQPDDRYPLVVGQLRPFDKFLSDQRASYPGHARFIEAALFPHGGERGGTIRLTCQIHENESAMWRQVLPFLNFPRAENGLECVGVFLGNASHHPISISRFTAGEKLSRKAPSSSRPLTQLSSHQAPVLTSHAEHLSQRWARTTTTANIAGEVANSLPTDLNRHPCTFLKLISLLPPRTTNRVDFTPPVRKSVAARVNDRTTAWEVTHGP